MRETGPLDRTLRVTAEAQKRSLRLVKASAGVSLWDRQGIDNRDNRGLGAARAGPWPSRVRPCAVPGQQTGRGSAKAEPPAQLADRLRLLHRSNIEAGRNE
jgi:hypothetical protein